MARGPGMSGGLSSGLATCLVGALVVTLLALPAWLQGSGVGPSGARSTSPGGTGLAQASTMAVGDVSSWEPTHRPGWWHSRVAPRSREHTVPGAVEAFVDQTLWFLVSPAARARPDRVLKSLGRRGQDPVDPVGAKNLDRDGLGAIALSRGAYRVFALSGPRSHPRQVMLEFTAPAQVDGRERWLVLGGVVGWEDRGWELRSLQPRYPTTGRGWTSSPIGRSDDLYDDLGWRRFTDAGSVRGAAR